jgi:hypothetical protein
VTLTAFSLESQASKKRTLFVVVYSRFLGLVEGVEGVILMVEGGLLIFDVAPAHVIPAHPVHHAGRTLLSQPPATRVRSWRSVDIPLVRYNYLT